MSEITQDTQKSHMPWWAVLGWVLCGIATFGLLFAVFTLEPGETMNPMGLIPWTLGFVLGVAGLVVKGLRR